MAARAASPSLAASDPSSGEDLPCRPLRAVETAEGEGALPTTVAGLRRWAAAAVEDAVAVGLGRIVALYCRSSTLCQIC